MVHENIGLMGHFFLIFSFVLSLFCSGAYLTASIKGNALSLENRQWKKIGQLFWHAHSVLVVAVIAILFIIIYSNYFEYHYAWEHSAQHLPFYYKLSCFWEGQEGSFLLWIFWNVILGIIVLRTSKSWENEVMTIFALVQAFLISMILGVVIGDVKLGSSPFLLLREVMTDAPIFQTQPDFIPENGTGLNPLLQNYWMVIHPPTLFLGYATTLVPFAFLIAGLWKGKFQDWIKPAIPWTIFSVATLGLGQLMGAYWAYETLSFGGYWNWDPVENAVYIPWIVQVAGLHTMIVYKRNNTALITSMILVMATFILILYATFLTRSGLLGEASVHSFTDSGLKVQLFAYLVAFLLISILLISFNWSKIPKSEKEVKTYSTEFWIFLGTIVLGLMAFQVFIGTSIPLTNDLLGLFGVKSNMAPPVDQIGYYTDIQIWGAVLIAILSATGLTVFWKNSKTNFFDALSLPIIVALIGSALIIVIADIKTFSYMILLAACFFSITANARILFKLLKTKPQISGGAVAHLGVAFMLLGILFSAGYSNVVSLNNSGITFSNTDEELNRENVLLHLNKGRKMKEYELVYRGQRKEVKGVSRYVDANILTPTDEDRKNVLATDLHIGSRVLKAGDTVQVVPEDTYYEIEYKKNGERLFTLFPRAQVNPSMGLIVSPDIKRNWNADLYTHISTIPDPDTPIEWGESEIENVQTGGQFIANDYTCTLNSVRRIDSVPGVNLNPKDVAVMANISIAGLDRAYEARPIFVIKDSMTGNIPATFEDIGVKISFINVHPETDSFDFAIQRTLILMIGFSMAVVRRYKEFRAAELSAK